MAKKAAPTAHHSYLWLTFVISGVLFFLGVWYVLVASKTPSELNVAATPTPTTQAKTFTASKVMGNFTIEVPSGFTVEEKFTTVTIKNKDKEILITFIGTNYASLKKLIESDLSLKARNFTFIKINNLEAAYEIKSDEKVYYIYKDYALYSIITRKSSLYSLLDQIAQSFRLPT